MPGEALLRRAAVHELLLANDEALVQEQAGGRNVQGV